MGEFLVYGVADGFDAGRDLVGVFRRVGVVGADVDDDKLGRDTVKFAMVDAPKDIFGTIPAEAQVGDGQVRETARPCAGRPDVRGLGLAGSVGDDRVADDDNVGVDLLVAREDFFVAKLPAIGSVVAVLGHGGCRDVATNSLWLGGLGAGETPCRQAHKDNAFSHGEWYSSWRWRMQSWEINTP